MGENLIPSSSWAHEICASDNEERAIVVGSMNEMAYVLQAWLPLIVWQQVDAPKYHKGFVTITFLSASLIATAFTTRYLHQKEIVTKSEKDAELDSTVESDGVIETQREDIKVGEKGFEGIV